MSRADAPASLSHVVWPPVPRLHTSSFPEVLQRFDATQRWSPDRLRAAQFAQLGPLLAYAWRHAPGYRNRLAASGYTPGMPLDDALWADIPILTRADLQDIGEDFHCREVPLDHGRVVELYSSGSSGTPVHTRGTELTNFLWQAVTLREHLWQGRDPSLKLVGLRPDRLSGERESRLPTWGKPADYLFRTGPSAMLNTSVPVDQQLDWLRLERPGYIITLPSNLQALARYALAQGVRLPGLRELRCYGEVVSDALRELVAEAFGVAIAANYGSQEVGMFALQAPGSSAYYVQAETMFLEVLDDEDRPCGPRETGRVVVTALHNFAMPIIRYEVQDYAEVGEPLGDGCGLPVLTRVIGRVRNMLRTPDGEQHWPSFPMRSWADVADIRQLQLEQTHLDRIRVNLVMSQPLSDEQLAQLRASLHQTLGYPFRIDFNYVSEIPRKPNGKYEDFVSLLDVESG